MCKTTIPSPPLPSPLLLLFSPSYFPPLPSPLLLLLPPPTLHLPTLHIFGTCTHTHQMSLLMERLIPHLEEILFIGHTGVVVSLAQAVCLCPLEQPSFLSALLSTFHTEDTPLCCGPLLLSLTTHEVYYAPGEEEKVGQEPSSLNCSVHY